MSKYAAQARDWTESAYGDASSYLGHRAELAVSLGPRLGPGDTVLDLACGDGGLAEFLPRGIHYRGADATPEMVEAARRRGHDVVLGDLNDYDPPQPVAATLCFRAIYYARDRRAFFERARLYTTKKLVFDLNPRQYRLEEVRRELREAGFERLALRPFLVPQRAALPAQLRRAAIAFERSGPPARLLLRLRFTYLCAAFSEGTKR